MLWGCVQYHWQRVLHCITLQYIALYCELYPAIILSHAIKEGEVSLLADRKRLRGHQSSFISPWQWFLKCLEQYWRDERGSLTTSVQILPPGGQSCRDLVPIEPFGGLVPCWRGHWHPAREHAAQDGNDSSHYKGDHLEQLCIDLQSLWELGRVRRRSVPAATRLPELITAVPDKCCDSSRSAAVHFWSVPEEALRSAPLKTCARDYFWDWEQIRADRVVKEVRHMKGIWLN